jgi:hypothetical protein
VCRGEHRVGLLQQVSKPKSNVVVVVVVVVAAAAVVVVVVAVVAVFVVVVVVATVVAVVIVYVNKHAEKEGIMKQNFHNLSASFVPIMVISWAINLVFTSVVGLSDKHTVCILSVTECGAGEV